MVCSCGKPLVRAEILTHDAAKYTLHNSKDGSVWQMTAAGGWERTVSRVAARGRSPDPDDDTWVHAEIRRLRGMR